MKTFALFFALGFGDSAVEFVHVMDYRDLLQCQATLDRKVKSAVTHSTLVDQSVTAEGQCVEMDEPIGDLMCGEKLCGT